MGTNYYLHPKPCECCGRHDKDMEVHIGKSSGGWCFSLHVGGEHDYRFEEAGLKVPHCLDDWKEIFKTDGYVISDEYGRPTSVKEMLDTIMNRSWNSRAGMTPEYLRSNHAVEGPNNLLRHKVDGRHCVGNGEGTWDYIVGEFS